MRAHPANRPLWMLLAGLAVVGGWAWFVNSFAPASDGLIAVFFLLTGIGATLLFSFFLNNVRHGVLLGAGGAIFLLLRMLGLRSPLYAILLLIVLASLELTWKKR